MYQVVLFYIGDNMIKCNLIWYNEKDKMVKCTVCGRITQTTQTNITKINYICRKQGKQEGKRILQPPAMVRRIKNFTIEAITHTVNGNPTCTQEEIDYRYNICKSCELFLPTNDGGICTHNNCGCTMKQKIVYLNGLAWADKECPLKKWLAIKK